ncbi:MAG: metallophosphoesterase family protein [Candidatus Margulisbacteria bacterium]|jgi:putative phosphoesterase|nr:metallophosphoesterase family protein [Candidatus Margulisiibacteriota bacterium]
MARLFIIADIHGLYSVWQKLLGRLQPDDTLAVAGDLFGNRYPCPHNPDYQPELIRQEYQALKNQKYFVYGNCDIPEFFPGQKYQLSFIFANKKVLLCHGDDTIPAGDHDIIISGHTHCAGAREQNGRLYINPGSPGRARDGWAGYALYADGQARLEKL